MSVEIQPNFGGEVEPKEPVKEQEGLRLLPRENPLVSARFRDEWNKNHGTENVLSPDTVPLTQELVDELFDRNFGALADSIERYLPFCIDKADGLLKEILARNLDEKVSNNAGWFVVNCTDKERVIKIIVKREETGYLYRCLDKLPRRSVDWGAIFDVFVKDFDEITALSFACRYGIEKTEIKKLIDKAIVSDELANLSQALEEIPTECIDAKLLLEAMFQKGMVGEVVHNIRSFIKHVGAGYVGARLLGGGYREAIINTFDKFPPGTFSAQDLLPQPINTHLVESIVAALEKFPKKFFDEDLLFEIYLASKKGKDKDAILRDVEKFFGRVDAKKMAEKLMQAGFVYTVARYFNEFPSGAVDAKEVVQLLEAKGKLVELVRSLEKLPQGCVKDIDGIIFKIVQLGEHSYLFDHFDGLVRHGADLRLFAKRLLELKYGVALANFIGLFPSDAVDAKELAEWLFKNGESETLLKNYHKFPEGSIDVIRLLDAIPQDTYSSFLGFFGIARGLKSAKALFEKMIEYGYATTVISDIDRFAKGAVDVQRLQEALYQLGRPNDILMNFDRFPEGSVDTRRLIHELNNSWLRVYLVNNLERFPEKEITSEIRRKFVINISEALGQRRFRQVKLWLENMIEKDGADSVVGMLDEVASNKEMKILLRDERLASARCLKACMEMTGTKLSPQLEKILKESEQYEEALPREPDTKKRIVADEVLDFFAGDLFKRKIISITAAEDWETRLEYKDRVAIKEIERECLRNKDELIKWIREYMIIAVSSELHHQSRRGLRTIWSHPSNMYATARREEILNFFASASYRFVGSSWGGAYGGSSWSRIARAGYAIWCNDSGPEGVVDNIFDLQHNTGTIFDKETRRVIQVESQLREVLDAKFSGDLIQSLPKLEGVCDPNLINRIYAKNRILERIMNKLGVGAV
jgi:hypothetical protein